MRSSVHRAIDLGLIAIAGMFMLTVGAASQTPSPRLRPSSSPALRYENAVLPLFSKRCLGCHGADHPRAGLDLRTRGNVIEGGHSGPAVIPGSPDKSLLWKVVSSGKMPPVSPKLTSAEKSLVERWIRSGASGKASEGHWAFRPLAHPAVPKVKASDRVRNPIDAFLLADLEGRNLSFSPEADRRTLIRRVTYDLIGLPPTPEEVNAFARDRSPQAYEKLVDRLLADPRYGERWARHWLDPAGYADSEGILQEDLIRPNAWRYRDYVIRSFNADKPYDRFLREQIAGDELFDYRNAEHFTPEIEEALTATGFLRTAVDATRTDFNAHQFQEYQLRMLNDMETILGTTVLGLPIQCARCHDHKYEPLSQKDYYRVQACFAGAVRPGGPLLPSRLRQVVAGGIAEKKAAAENNAKVDAAQKIIAAKLDALVSDYRARHLQARIGEVPETSRAPLQEAARLEPAKRTPAQKALVEKYRALAEAPVEALEKQYPDFHASHVAIQKARQAEEIKRIILPEIRALYDQDATPPETKLLIRGEWARQGDAVKPGIPSILDDSRQPFTIPNPEPSAKTTGRRKALAEWITRPDNPLTARVIVNRIWSHHFGIGIVQTVDNFGRSGAAPSNRKLLDWLAVELAGPRHWSLKSIHRLIVTSSAYRQASQLRPEAARVDPENVLLWRQRPRRLEAEAIRDAMLAVAGNLDPKMYGEAVRTEIREGGDVVPVGEVKGGRRSIYLLVRRSEPVTVLNTFDAPVMETNCTRRTVSSTATQSLAMMNSSFISTQALQFARRLLKDRPAGNELSVSPAVVRQAFRLAFSREPSPAELASAEGFLREQTARYGKMNKEPKTVVEMAVADFAQALLGANEFVYLD